MLRITITDQKKRLAFQLEGRLAGPWVRELELCWRGAKETKGEGLVEVDLTAVVFIDEDGKALLGRMHREGAKLVATGCLNKCIVEGIMHSEQKKAEG